MLYILSILLMVGSCAGICICAKKQKSLPAAKPIAGGLIAILLISVILFLFASGIFGPSYSEKLGERETGFANASAWFLGNFLATKFPGSKALIIVDSKEEEGSRLNGILQSLREGLEGKIEIVAVSIPDVAPKEYNVEQSGPPDVVNMLQAEHLDKLIKKHRSCNMIISFIGLPREGGELEIWDMEKTERPKFVIASGDFYPYGNEIMEGKIIAAVAAKQNIPAEEYRAPLPDDPKMAFEKRYHLITPENVKAIAVQDPRVFDLAEKK